MASVEAPCREWKGLPAWLLAETGVTQDAEGLVYLPYRTAGGDLYARRVVAPSGRRWWEPGDGRAVLPFGLDRLTDAAYRGYRCLAFAEGESDALALWGTLGHEGLDVLGVPGAATWRQEWAAHAEGYDGVYVFGDGDEAGTALNCRVCEDVPAAVWVELPKGEDVRSLLRKHGTDPLIDAMSEAEALVRLSSGLLEGIAA